MHPVSLKQLNMKLLFYIAAPILFIVASCSSGKTVTTDNNTASQTPLYDTKWILRRIYTDSVTMDVNTKAFIRFDKEKNSAGGNGSCNSFGSTTTINGNEVSLKDIFSTKMFCEAVQKTENAYFNLLSKTTRYEITDNTLTLYNNSIALLMFQAE